eukprot:3895641-Pyramimonas_sp.AAC.1
MARPRSDALRATQGARDRMARLTPGCARGLQTGVSSRSAQTLRPTPPKPPPPWLTAIMEPATWN